jgi:hypothetical protein
VHKLTIAVRNSDIFQQQLKEGLENYINENADTESDKQELHHRLDEMVKDENYDFHKLLKLVDKETLGNLKKEAKITYIMPYRCLLLSAGRKCRSILLTASWKNRKTGGFGIFCRLMCDRSTL